MADPLKPFAGKVVFVTGAARGIGRGCARRFADRGATVVAFDRDLAGAAVWGEELTAATVEEELRALSGDSAAFEVDLALPGDVVDAFAEATSVVGAPDVLVNVAGGAFTPIERSRASKLTDEDISTMINANLITTINCCRAVAPVMTERGSGAIINTTSVGAERPHPDGYVAAYGLAKAAVAHFTRSLANELGPAGVRVNVVAPGITTTARVVAQSKAGTNIVNDDVLMQIPLRRFATPEDVADVAEFLAGDLAGYVTGQTIFVSGGYGF